MDYPITIYAIRHNVTNRVYVGSSKNAEKRIKSHLSQLRGHRHIVEDMQSDFDKYGEDYTITILEEVFNYQDRLKEYDWMVKYNSHIRGKGYNYKDVIFKKRFNRSTVKKRAVCLTEDEKELIEIIRSSENPQETLLTAIKVFSSF